MNHDDPRLTQHVLGEENSAEMTEALNNDPALQQEAEALQATADRMAQALAQPADEGSQAFAAGGPPRREPPTVLARLGGSLGVGIAAAVAAMVVWIGPGSNESMGPMANAAACCIADECVELSAMMRVVSNMRKHVRYSSARPEIMRWCVRPICRWNLRLPIPISR